MFHPGFNPTKFVIASNGVDLWYGYADHVEPLSRASVANLGPYSSDVAALHDLMSWKKLEAYAQTLSDTVKPAGFFKPRRKVR